MLIASLIILQVLIFAGLIFMLRKIMTQNVVSATRHLDELNIDYSKKEEEITQKQAQVKREAEESVAQAQQEALRMKTEMIKEAESRRDQILEQARNQGAEIMQQADKSRQMLLSEIDERVSKEAITKACELINYTLPEKFKRDVHTHWIEEIIESGFEKLQRLHVPEDVSEVKVTSAFPLTDEQRRSIEKKVKDVFGREIKIKEEVDPNVCVGLVISVGSLVFDGSLKNKIQEQAKDVQRTK